MEDTLKVGKGRKSIEKRQKVGINQDDVFI